MKQHPQIGSGQRTRQIALRAIAILVVAGTATAFVQSYEGLYGWASRYLSEGWSRTWPIQVDAWIAVGELALYVGYRDRWPARRKIWPWLAALTGLAASTGFNVGHLGQADLAGQLTAAVPPVAAFGGLFVGLQVLKYIEHDAERTRVAPAGIFTMPEALQLACRLVAADRSLMRRMASHHRWPVNGPNGQPTATNGQHPWRVATPALNGHRRRTAPDLEAQAARILAAEPAITGAELARRLGVAERTGRRMIGRLKA